MDLNAIKIKEGDTAAFDHLFMTYHHRVFLYCLKFTRAEEDAKEIMQETFLLIWKKRSRLDPHQAIEGLVFKIARDLSLNHLRRKLREQAALDRLRSEHAFAEDTPEASSFTSEHYAMLTGAISALPEKQRIIFRMNRFMGLSYEHIAERLGISRNTVKVQIVRANKSIKKVFAHILIGNS